MKTNDLRYTAGLFDADGWVWIPRRKSGSFVVECGVANCYLPVLEWLKERFGGGIYSMGRSTERHRMLYQWKVASASAAKFAKLIRPHTIIKKDQLDLAIKLQDSIDRYRYKFGGWKLREHPEYREVWAYRARLAKEIRELKHVRFDNL